MGGCLSARDLSVGSPLKLSRRWLVDPCKGSSWAVQLLVLGIESLTTKYRASFLHRILLS